MGDALLRKAISAQLSDVGIDPDFPAIKREIDLLELSYLARICNLTSSGRMEIYWDAASALLAGRVTVVGFVDSELVYRRCDGDHGADSPAFTWDYVPPATAPIYCYRPNPAIALETVHAILNYVAATGHERQASSFDALSVLLGVAVGISSQLVDEEDLKEHPESHASRRPLHGT